MTEAAKAVRRPGAMRRLYDWVLSLADTPYAVPALALLAFAESSFFPIPPDVLLLALCLGLPGRSFRFALVCSVCSVLGGILGYTIGYGVEPLGRWIITHIASPEKFDVVAEMYGNDAFFFITVAAFTPIPYKVFTIAAGMFHDSVPLTTLVLASIVGRSGRFFLVAGLVYKFGPPVRDLINKYFDRIMWIFLVLLVLSFASLKLMGGHHPLELEETLGKLRSDNANVRVMRIEQVRMEAGREFGFDPELAPGDPANQDPLEQIRLWFEQQAKQGDRD
ncbi:MAG: DedA family protein [Planctomycetota bacterium]